jgi:hypothetical protein
LNIPITQLIGETGEVCRQVTETQSVYHSEIVAFEKQLAELPDEAKQEFERFMSYLIQKYSGIFKLIQ